MATATYPTAGSQYGNYPGASNYGGYPPGDSRVLPLSFWSTGGLWDLSSLTGAQSSSISATIPSLIGANVLTPSATVNPRLHQNAIMGRNSARVMEDTATGVNFQYFTCHALSSLFQGPIASLSATVFMYVRVQKVRNAPFWSCLRGDGGNNERLFGRISSTELIQLQKYQAGAANTYSTARHPDPYSSMLVMWVLNGGNAWIYFTQEGKPDITKTALGAYESTALPAAVNRFTFGASLNSIPYEQLSGYMTMMGAASGAPTDAQISSFFASVQASDYILPRTSARSLIFPGDSITKCSEDDRITCGHREILATYCYDNGLSYMTYANGQGGGGTGVGGIGIYRMGSSGNTFTSSNSGQSIAQIEVQALLDISGAPTPVRLYPCIMGDGDNNSLVAPATIASRYQTSALNIMAAGVARDPLFRMSVTDLPPLDPATLGAIETNALAFNALLPAVWDAIDAAYPSNKVFRWSARNCFPGAVYSVPYYKDTSHPNRAGNAVMALHPTYGLLWASDGTQNLATWLRANSPTTSKPCMLVGNISAPTGGASLPNATPVTVTADCSRAACKAEFNVDGVTIATMLPADTYSFFLAGGAYAPSQYNSHTYSWTPGAGAIGARALTVTFTDPDGSTITTTATVNVTVT